MTPSPATDGGTGSLFAGYRGRLLFGTSAAWISVMTGRLLLPPLLPTIISEFDITLASAGLLLTVLQAVSASVLYTGGRLSDELSRATLIVPALGVLALGFALIAGAPTYPVLVVAAATVGLGSGAFTVPARALVSDHFVDRRGRALGVFTAAFNVGGVVASLIAVVALASWRLAFGLIAAALVALGTLFVVWNREPYRVEAVELGVRATVRRLLANPQLRMPLVAYSLFYFVTRSFLGFFPAYLQGSKGFSPRLASGAFALVFAVGVVSKIGAGALSDRFSRRSVAVVGLVVATAALGAIIAAESLVVLGLVTVLFAAGHQSQFPLMDAILLDAAPDDNLGGDLGAARTVFFFVGSLGPVYVGYVAQAFSFTLAFLGLVVCLLATAGLLAYQWRRL